MHLYILFLVRMFSLHLIRSDLHVVFVWPQKKKEKAVSFYCCRLVANQRDIEVNSEFPQLVRLRRRCGFVAFYDLVLCVRLGSRFFHTTT